MAEETQKIGARIQERRKELGLSQRELAERLPGTYQGSDISRWERGKHRPEILVELANALDTDVADLVSGPLAERAKPNNADLSDALSQAEPGSSKVEQMLEEVLNQQAQLLADVSQVRSELELLSQQQARPERGRAAKHS